MTIRRPISQDLKRLFKTEIANEDGAGPATLYSVWDSVCQGLDIGWVEDPVALAYEIGLLTGKWGGDIEVAEFLED